MGKVILVDEKDNKIGLMKKAAAHRTPGHLHRAISVLLYRKKDGKTEALLQQRGHRKPLWPLFWANTVCTHPRDKESLTSCAVRRLKEEMGIGIDEKKLRVVFPLIYASKYNEEFSEREVDHILVGEWDGEPKLNKREAEDYQWIELIKLKKDIDTSQKYAPWFTLIVQDKRLHKTINTL